MGISTGSGAGAGTCAGAGAGAGTPAILALLKGLEKLNAGLGRCVPPIDISELTEGDLTFESNPGENPVGEDENPLAIEGFR